MKGLVIWAHSKCRSTYGLYCEVVRQSPDPVRIVFRQGALDCRRAQGFADETFDDVPSVVIGEDAAAAEAILAETVGWTHVVTSYQVSPMFRHVMKVAHGRGDRVVVYSEAPFEMCIGPLAALKRLYYRWILPWRVRSAVRSADLFLSASGVFGKDRLLRLGWPDWKIVPFGYASPALAPAEERRPRGTRLEETRPRDPLVVLHLGREAPYRGVAVLERAVRLTRAHGTDVTLRKTGGDLPLAELVAAIREADVVIACGLCEPWGMRVNDALLEGVPVIVSDGMGVAWSVERQGCGVVVPKNEPRALARVLARFRDDADFRARLRSGAEQAARTLRPEARAREWLEAVCG